MHEQSSWSGGAWALLACLLAACTPGTAPGAPGSGSAAAKSGQPFRPGSNAAVGAAGALGPALSGAAPTQAGTGPGSDVEPPHDDAATLRALAVADEDPEVPPSWARRASVGTVSGYVYDAHTGDPIEGFVYTTAECTGKGCTYDSSSEMYSAPISGGSFEFSSGPANLTLRPQSAFYFRAEGYEVTAVAHGPNVELENETVERSPNQLMPIYLCVPKADDHDKDGICDDAERRYGTDPEKPDTDSDALSDTLELYGHRASEHSDFYDIYSLGADPLHADIFLAIRYTQKSRLKREAFSLVQAAFGRAPNDNPSRRRGFALHILFDEVAIVDPADDVANLTPVWEEFDRLAKKYFGLRPLAFHYALFANMYDGEDSSGLSRDWGASDFVVTMGGVKDHGTVLEQAGTLMHELGHNLGLHHNGDTDEDYVGHYPSVMSYAYQFVGLERPSGTMLDFAAVEIDSVDEEHVNEQQPFKPFGMTTKDELRTYLNPRFVFAAPWEEGQTELPQAKGSLGSMLDLNGDGRFDTDVAIDLNASGGEPDHYGPTRNDWASLELAGGTTGFVGDGVVNPTRRTVDEGVKMPPCLPPQRRPAAPPTASTPPAETGSAPTDAPPTTPGPDEAQEPISPSEPPQQPTDDLDHGSSTANGTDEDAAGEDVGGGSGEWSEGDDSTGGEDGSEGEDDGSEEGESGGGEDVGEGEWTDDGSNASAPEPDEGSEGESEWEW